MPQSRTSRGTFAQVRRQFGANNPRATHRDHLIMACFGVWIAVGGHLDAYAHRKTTLESFFTPWHAVVYTGLLGSAVWLAVLTRRYGRVPVGYGMGLLGIALFAVGGLADMAWHEILGIEVDLEAAVSPSHNLLLVAGSLLLATPLRAIWLDEEVGTPTLWELLPAVLSITSCVVVFSLPLTGLSAFSELVGGSAPPVASAMTELQGFSSMLLTTVILMAPILALYRRWSLPFGSVTLLFGAVASSPAISGAPYSRALLAGVVGGVAADLFIHVARRWDRTVAIRLFGAFVPTVVWTAYFAMVAGFYDLTWSLALWTGVTTKAALVGLGLALLLTLPAPANAPLQRRA